jgi:hypothetical protein
MCVTVKVKHFILLPMELTGITDWSSSWIQVRAIKDSPLTFTPVKYLRQMFQGEPTTGPGEGPM